MTAFVWFMVALFASPRLALLVIAICSSYIGRAWHDSWIGWPIIGWFFMPWTTLWCAYVFNNGGFNASPWYVVLCVLTVFVDLFSDESARRR